MKKLIVSVALLFFAAGFTLAEDAATPPATKKIEPRTVILKVDGDPVVYGSLVQATKAVAGGLISQGRHGNVSMSDPKVREQVMMALLRRTALVHAALRTPPEKLDEQAGARFEVLRSRFPTEEAWKGMLAEEGLDEPLLKALVREDIALGKYLEAEVTSKVKITDLDINAYYNVNKKTRYALPDQVELAHILKKVDLADPASVEEGKKKLSAIRARLAAGEDFATVAGKESADPMTRPNGGLLGLRGKTDLPDEVAEACFKLADGELSDVVQSEFGLHLFKALSHRAASTRTLEEARDEIRETLTANAIALAVEKKGDELAKAAKVEILMPHLLGEKEDSAK